MRVLTGTTRARAVLGPAVLMLAVGMLAACSSGSSSSSTPSSNNSSSSSSKGGGSGGLKTGLKVFVIPKNLGNPYFTTSDSVKSGGALAALSELGETGTETSGTAATPTSQIPAIQAAITKGANVLDRVGDRPDSAVPDPQGSDGQGHHCDHIRLGRARLP